MSYFGKNIKKIRSIKKMSQSVFAEQFNLTRASIGAYEEGRAEAKIDTIINIANFFGISLDALLTKELTINEIYHFNVLKHEQNKNNKTSINESITPLIYEKKRTEYIENIKNKDFFKQLPSLKFPANIKTPTRAFEFSGCEMHFNNNSGLHNGDILFCVSIDKKFPDAIKTDKIFVIITNEDFLIRRLIKIDKNIELKADNPIFPSIVIPYNQIIELWEVKGLYTNKLQAPSIMEEKMLYLENEMNRLKEHVKKMKIE